MTNPRKDVRNFLTLVGSAVALAFVVVVGLVYYYGPSGTHLLRGVLISPASLKTVEFKEPGRFISSKIEFVNASPSGRGWGRFAVSRESYAAFYDQVEHLRSVPRVSNEEVMQFDQVTPSTLTIFVQQKGKGLLFQEVQFLEGGDLFRVQARQDDEWIYFRKDGIFAEVVRLFTAEGAA